MSLSISTPIAGMDEAGKSAPFYIDEARDACNEYLQEERDNLGDSTEMPLHELVSKIDALALLRGFNWALWALAKEGFASPTFFHLNYEWSLRLKRDGCVAALPINCGRAFVGYKSINIVRTYFPDIEWQAAYNGVESVATRSY